MRRVPRIAPILECVEGGVESVIEALRFSQEDESARAFLQKYDSVPPADLEYLTVDEIRVASGADPKRLLTLALDWLVKISLMKAQIAVYSSLPRVAGELIKSAVADKGTRDRRLFFQITGFLPTPHPRGSVAVPPTTRARKKTEAQPEARPAGSPRVLNQPWPLPSKTR
jgi:hypothetical protein